jgi:hypothetical protein
MVLDRGFGVISNIIHGASAIGSNTASVIEVGRKKKGGRDAEQCFCIELEMWTSLGVVLEGKR